MPLTVLQHYKVGLPPFEICSIFLRCWVQGMFVGKIYFDIDLIDIFQG